MNPKILALAALLHGASAGKTPTDKFGATKAAFSRSLHAAKRKSLGQVTAPKTTTERRRLDDYPAYDDWGGGSTVFCSSDLNDQIIGPSSAEECWESCHDVHGASIVAIDWEMGADCFCQDACDCMQDLSGTLTNRVYVVAGLAEPNNCDSTGCDNSPLSNCIMSNSCSNDDVDDDDDDDDDDDVSDGDDDDTPDFSCAGYEPVVAAVCADYRADIETWCEECVTESDNVYICYYESVLASFGLECDMASACSGGGTVDAAGKATWTAVSAAAAFGVYGFALL